jgi:hypothetical protein
MMSAKQNRASRSKILTSNAAMRKNIQRTRKYILSRIHDIRECQLACARRTRPTFIERGHPRASAGIPGRVMT